MKVWSLALVIGVCLSAQTYAAGNPAAGQNKAARCLGCHGKDGVAVIPGYPNLKGQNEQYLVESMQAYKKGRRTGGLAGMMKSQVAGLSDQDIDDIAAYFANL
ncbi:c-type cytochrome [Vibrio zhugei]|uniref:C-type cytochrome n=1 Tax=Vibrio zhugei TaxID=2479546 RepID=A0ABV7C6E4_9VIBR|nr:cytochrome c [Vibrio zhugei]